MVSLSAFFSLKVILILYSAYHKLLGAGEMLFVRMPSQALLVDSLKLSSLFVSQLNAFLIRLVK